MYLRKDPRKHRKLSKWDSIKLRSFCITDKIINKMKSQLTEWEKTVANSATDNGLILGT